MTLTGYTHYLRGGNQSTIVIGCGKESATWVIERYQYPDRIIALLKKILGSFLQNKQFEIPNMALRPSACGLWYSKSRLGLCHITEDYSECNSTRKL